MLVMSVINIAKPSSTAKIPTLTHTVEGTVLSHALYNNDGHLLARPGLDCTRAACKAIMSHYDTRPNSKANLYILGLDNAEVGAVETFKFMQRSQGPQAVPRVPRPDLNPRIDQIVKRGVYAQRDTLIYFGEDVVLQKDDIDILERLTSKHYYYCTFNKFRRHNEYWSNQGFVLRALVHTQIALSDAFGELIRSLIANDAAPTAEAATLRQEEIEAIVRAYAKANSTLGNQVNAIPSQTPEQTKQQEQPSPPPARKKTDNKPSLLEQIKNAGNNIIGRQDEPEKSEEKIIADAPSQPLASIASFFDQALDTLVASCHLLENPTRKFYLGTDAQQQQNAIVDEAIERFLAYWDPALLNKQITAEADISRYLLGHSLKVSLLSMFLAKTNGKKPPEIKNLGLAALNQDLGMGQLPPDMIHKQTPLTQAELLALHAHPVTSAEMVGQITATDDFSSGEIAEIILHSHERPNGSGYPAGLKGHRINTLSRTLHVANTYTALVSPRPFRPELPPQQAVDLLLQQRERKQLDGRAVDSLVEIL